MNLFRLAKLAAKNVAHYGLKPFQASELDAEEKKVLASLHEQGFAVLPQFLSKDECAALRAEIDTLMDRHSAAVWRDDLCSDERFHGLERYSELALRRFHADSKIQRILDAYEKGRNKSGFTMAGRLSFKAGNVGSGGGWHRDRADFKQSKALIYLSDVSSSHGPFEYIVGSHRPLTILSDSLKMGLHPLEARITDAQIQTLLGGSSDRLRTFVAPAGTMLLVDTRGLHRGRPIQEGRRYALTQYNWYGSPVPEHIAKLLITP